MSQKKIWADISESANKSLKGLKNAGVVNFKCADCGKHLLVLRLVTTEKDNVAKVQTRIAVQCGLCGGYSYVQQISGQFYPGAPNDNMAFDVSDDNTCTLEADVLFKAWAK